jgi:hypothetical protein
MDSIQHHKQIHEASNTQHTKDLKTYIKTGQYNFMPGVNEKDYDSETDLKEAL